MRDSTEVHPARKNERTELTKAISTHFTSACCSAALERLENQARLTGPPELPFEFTRSEGTQTPTVHSRKPWPTPPNRGLCNARVAESRRPGPDDPRCGIEIGVGTGEVGEAVDAERNNDERIIMQKTRLLTDFCGEIRP